ncbi:hypothetical protein PCANC_24334 [Puccinia coronata f. sp. avenae]|uniref:Uncharacterized protein n=1 Tax=Puccinia coronata f. sp. avenae TaxID=200324 RepID=A0A2N5TV88_9BASI|nr:hypothetical protein PCANC_24334 [Puccinia coronata f. sp. avenae]
MTSDQAPQPTPEATSALVADAPAIWENFAPNKAPSQATFEEFTVKPNDTAAAVPLNPDAPILVTKIQQITAKEFGQTITAAQQVTEDLQKLKLPRSWRELVETLTHSITSTKRKFKEIGKIPDEEAIKPPSKSPSPHEPEETNFTPAADSQNPADQDSLSSSAAPAIPTGTHTGSTQPPIPPRDPSPVLTPANAGANLDQGQDPANPSPTSPNSDAANNAPPVTTKPSDSAQTSGNPAAATHTNNNEETAAPSQATNSHPESSTTSSIPPTSTSTTPTTNTAPGDPPRPSPKPLTILKSDDVRLHVIVLYRKTKVSKPLWEVYQNTWTCLGHLINFWAHSVETTPPARPDFHFQRTLCSYASWIKTISSLASKFLSPSKTEQWYCPNIINVPLLDAFGDKENPLPPKSYISTRAKIPHAESTLVRFLYRLSYPAQSSISDWAKLVAASVELMADNLFTPPPPTQSNDEEDLIMGVDVLQHIKQIKNSSSSFASMEDNPATDSASNQGSHSVDVLNDFRNIILDVMAAYVILQTHSLRPRSLTDAAKKAQARSNARSTRESTSALVDTGNTSSALTKKRDDSVCQLQAFQRGQNFQPHVFFVLTGFRGLFVASRNYRNSQARDCMSFIQAMKFIKKHSTASHAPEEPIWKSLLAYIVQTLSPVFACHNKITPLSELPTGHKIAQAITIDFLKPLAYLAACLLMPSVKF